MSANLLSTTIHVRSAEADLDTPVQLSPGEAVLIGRRPDPGRINWRALRRRLAELAGEGNASPESVANPADGARRSQLADGSSGESGTEASAGFRVRTLPVQAKSASANHVLVLCLPTRTVLLDLESRNGSWLQLSPGQPCSAGAGVDLTVMLSNPAVDPTLRAALRTALPDAEWSGAAQFSEALARVLRAWLAQVASELEVVIRPAGQAADGAFPLADGTAIELRQIGTLHVALDELLEKVRRYIHDQNARYFQLERRVAGMVVESAVMRQILLRTAETAAAGRRMVLLGPTGVGKELLARSYHGYSPRHDGPFVSINCALLDKHLLYAQLFGARRGSYTGAVTDIAGWVEAADGGTLFLDELAEMPLEVQAALLRFLDTRGEYVRLGDSRPRQVKVQVVCASNAPLDDASYRAGRFRDDLWYRLAASVLQVPSLRERREDILAYLYSRTLPGGKLAVAQALSPAALRLVLDDDWPGNFRDLENFVDRLPVLAPHERLAVDTCQRLLREGRPAVSPDREARQPLGGPRRGEPSGRLAARDDSQALSSSNQEIDWPALLNTALCAFLSDHGDDPAGWHQLHRFIEQYLKPSYIGHSTALLGLQPLGPGVNYSALARSLHVADGKTVKTHLVRFEERFARPSDKPS